MGTLFSAGSSGFSGAQGTSGHSGGSGFSGTAGSDGVSGYSDYSGGGGASTPTTCKVWHNTTHSIFYTLTWVTHPFNSERWDPDGMHDNATNNSRITISTSGKYRIFGTINFGASGTGYRGVRIRKNGSTVIAQSFEADSNYGSSYNFVLNVVGSDDLTSGDYLELQYFAGSVACNSQSTSYSPSVFLSGSDIVVATLSINKSQTSVAWVILRPCSLAILFNISFCLFTSRW